MAQLAFRHGFATNSRLTEPMAQAIAIGIKAIVMAEQA